MLKGFHIYNYYDIAGSRLAANIRFSIAANHNVACLKKSRFIALLHKIFEQFFVCFFYDSVSDNLCNRIFILFQLLCFSLRAVSLQLL